MAKADLRKQLDSYKAKAGEFRVLTVPPLQYLMVDGHGDPNTSKEFSEALQLLYPVAYKLKFASKLELDKDYTVMTLEGLWWADDMSTFTTARDKSQWDFTVMIMQPDWITKDMFKVALQKVRAKNPSLALDKVRLETLTEELCVQTLHIGSYDDETATLAELHDNFIPNNGYKMVKKHHEIYLSDARRVAPEKLRTILRQPITSI